VCSGSPIDLKEKFGSGYRLIITKDVSFNEANFNEFFFKSTSGMKPSIQSNAAREMTILVPSNLKSKLAVLLVNLERLKDSLGILNYGISSSTVEEVFLK
jgi:ATP-binding cassette subfamily A (ABC1) protein 3